MRHPNGNSIILELIKGSKKIEQPIVLFFTAEWSGATWIMESNLNYTCERLNPLAECIWLDFDENQGLAQELNVHEIPTMILVKAGEVLGHVSGILPRFQLIQLIAQWLNLPPEHELLRTTI